MPAAPSPYDAGPHPTATRTIPSTWSGVGCEGVRACGNPHPLPASLNCFIPNDGGGARRTTCGESVSHQTLGEKSSRPTIRTTTSVIVRRAHYTRVSSVTVLVP